MFSKLLRIFSTSRRRWEIWKQLILHSKRWFGPMYGLPQLLKKTATCNPQCSVKISSCLDSCWLSCTVN